MTNAKLQRIILVDGHKLAQLMIALYERHFTRRLKALSEDSPELE